MEKKSYLTPNQVERLVNIFADEEQYTEHLKTLWALRRSVTDKMGYPDREIDTTSPLFRIFDLTNKMIGAISDNSVYICNGQVIVDKRLKRDR